MSTQDHEDVRAVLRESTRCQRVTVLGVLVSTGMDLRRTLLAFNRALTLGWLRHCGGGEYRKAP